MIKSKEVILQQEFNPNCPYDIKNHMKLKLEEYNKILADNKEDKSI